VGAGSLERKSSHVTKSGAGAQSKATKPAASTPAKGAAATSKNAAATKAAPTKAASPAGGAAGSGKAAKGAAAAPTAKSTSARAQPATAAKGASAKATDAAGGGASGEHRAGLSAKLLDKLRKRLEDERAKELQQAEELLAEAEALAVEREQGDTQFDEESGEGDTLSVERERDLALSASARQSVEEIERALERMDRGRYGLCERCSKRIAPARLEALPQAALCIECASRLVRRR
jgi:RNA polymerase-binding transcription factor DksA